MEEFYNKLVDNPDHPVPEKSRFVYSEEYSQTVSKPFAKRTAESDLAKSSKKKKPLISPSLVVNTMTTQEKKTLGENIRRLPRDSLKRVWEIVCSGNVGNEELKFDLDKLPTHIARELEKYVNSQFDLHCKGEFGVKESLQTAATYKQKF